MGHIVLWYIKSSVYCMQNMGLIMTQYTSRINTSYIRVDTPDALSTERRLLCPHDRYLIVFCFVFFFDRKKITKVWFWLWAVRWWCWPGIFMPLTLEFTDDEGLTSETSVSILSFLRCRIYIFITKLFL